MLALPVVSDSDQASIKPARKRAKHTRSRLGCGVCRIRRVRCDRARPSCERCTKTGRSCDGYPAGSEVTQQQSSDSKSSASLSPSSAPRSLLPQSIRVIDTNLHRSLHYWQHKAALEFSGYFHNDLWSTLVLQISHREKCVRQVVIALGLLHESFHKDHTNPRGLGPVSQLRRQALHQYSEGVTLLNQHIASQGWAGLEITLLCSILCVAFEWLRGDYPSAHTHLRSSMLIMSQWYAKNTFIPNSTSFWSPSGHLIRNKLKPLCTSLVLQARTMPVNPSLPFELPSGLEVSMKPFTSLQEARESLDVMLAYTLPETIARKAGTSTAKIKYWESALRLSRWSQSFDEYLADHRLSDEDAPRISIMKLWYTTARILFMASLSEDEGDFNRFLPEFQHIVDTVETLLSSITGYFSVDIGVVPLLYYVSLKCRHPITRRRAITMLESVPRREAVWDSMGAAQVVRQVVEVEEAGLSSVDHDTDIPSDARVSSIALVPDMENRQIRMKTKRQGDEVLSCEKVLIW